MDNVMIGEFEGSVHIVGNGQDIEITEALTAYVHDAVEGGYWAEVPRLPGCVTEGDTLDEVVRNLNEAISGWLESQTEASLDAFGVQYQRVLGAGKTLPLSTKHLFRTLEFAA